MHRKHVAFAAALLRESVAFVTGLVIGKALARRGQPSASRAPRSASEAVAQALQRAERERNARNN